MIFGKPKFKGHIFIQDGAIEINKYCFNIMYVWKMIFQENLILGFPYFMGSYSVGTEAEPTRKGKQKHIDSIPVWFSNVDSVHPCA